jgi:hypothetical protein
VSFQTFLQLWFWLMSFGLIGDNPKVDSKVLLVASYPTSGKWFKQKESVEAHKCDCAHFARLVT